MGSLRRHRVLFSIITVNKDDAGGLRRTIESVRRLGPRDREYIVIDGASTDGSVRVIEEERDCVDAWISEPDSGVYQAMNKGIARAKGDYCLFMNSGDVLCGADRLDTLAGGGHDIYYSDAAMVASGARTVIEYPKSLDLNFFVSGMINHQNALIRRSLFAQIGLFDESLRLSSDWLFFLKAAYSRQFSFRHIGDPIAEFSIGGISSRSGSGDIIRREREYGIRQVFGDFAPTILELVEYRDSVYGNTVRLFGRTKALDLFVRSYRFFARLLKLRPHRDDAKEWR
jgi:glycosyltransferase involved in cell wall biosynthesis